DGTFAAQAFGVTGRGTFEHGTSVLQYRPGGRPPGPPDDRPGGRPPGPPDDRPGGRPRGASSVPPDGRPDGSVARGTPPGPRARPSGLREPSAEEKERLDLIRGTLLAFREGRDRPARDDKIVAAWNGMAIGALAEAGVLFDRPDLVRAASAAAELLVSVHL